LLLLLLKGGSLIRYLYIQSRYVYFVFVEVLF
jgi:hypothetical protein